MQQPHYPLQPNVGQYYAGLHSMQSSSVHPLTGMKQERQFAIPPQLAMHMNSQYGNTSQQKNYGPYSTPHSTGLPLKMPLYDVPGGIMQGTNGDLSPSSSSSDLN